MPLSGKDGVIKLWNWIKETKFATATGSDKEWQKKKKKIKKKQLQKRLEPVYLCFYKPFFLYRPIKGTLANSVDPDQTPQNAASDQGQQFALNTAISINMLILTTWANTGDDI